MTSPAFSWDTLGRYKAEGRFLDGYPDDQRTFFAPRDTCTDCWSPCSAPPSTPSR